MPKGQTLSRIQRIDKLMRRLKTAGYGGVKYSTLLVDGIYGPNKRAFDYDKQYLFETYEVVISYDRRNDSYVLKDEGSYFFAFRFGETEAEALALGLKMIAHVLPHTASSARKVWDKLKAYVPLEAGGNAESLAQIMEIPGKPDGTNGRVFAMLAEAIMNTQTVNIMYKESGQPVRRLIVSPCSICFTGGKWYLKAEVPLGSSPLFAISGIKDVRLEQEGE